MNGVLNRRTWIKSAGLITAGLSFALEGVNSAVAAPLKKKFKVRSPEDAKIKAFLTKAENHWGPSPKAIRAIQEHAVISNKYPTFPDNLTRALIEKIAAVEKVTPDQVMLGAGSAEVLETCTYHYGQMTGSIIASEITYASSDYTLVKKTQNLGGEWDKVPLKDNNEQDLEEMERRVTPKTTLVYIVNPNSKFGNVHQPDALRAFIDRVSVKKPVLIDEAYIEYTGDLPKYSMMDKVREGKNVIISRTFSKCYGLAGCRVGYMISTPEIMTQLKKHSLQNFTLSRMGLAAALATYDDQDFLASVRNNLNLSKEFLYKFLESKNLSYYPSVTHYVNFDINMDGEKFKKAMLAEGVTVSTSIYREKHQCNLTLGTMEEMKIFKDAFNKIYVEDTNLTKS